MYTFTEQERRISIQSAITVFIQSICGQKPDCARSGRFQK